MIVCPQMASRASQLQSSQGCLQGILEGLELPALKLSLRPPSSLEPDSFYSTPRQRGCGNATEHSGVGGGMGLGVSISTRSKGRQARLLLGTCKKDVVNIMVICV